MAEGKPKAAFIELINLNSYEIYNLFENILAQ